MRCPSCGRENTIVERSGDAWCIFEHRTVAVVGFRKKSMGSSRSQTNAAKNNRAYYLRHRLEHKLKEGASSV